MPARPAAAGEWARVHLRPHRLRPAGAGHPGRQRQAHDRRGAGHQPGSSGELPRGHPSRPAPLGHRGEQAGTGRRLPVPPRPRGAHTGRCHARSRGPAGRGPGTSARGDLLPPAGRLPAGAVGGAPGQSAQRARGGEHRPAGSGAVPPQALQADRRSRCLGAPLSCPARHPATGGRPRRPGPVVVALVAAAALAVVASACGGAAPRPTPSHLSRPAPPLSTTTTVARPVDPRTALDLAPWATVVARALVPQVPVYPAPGSAAASSRLSNPNNLGAPLVFRVTLVDGPWLQVMLPVRPNGATGWIQRSAVQLFDDSYRVVVHLDSHSLVLMDDGAVIETHPVIVGMPSAPTPTGDFYVTELLKAPDPNGPYGPYAFGLSGFSDTYSEFDGGPGQIAIHGTDQPGLMGQNASHGCVRVTNDVVSHLATVLPLGSPVLITA